MPVGSVYSPVEIATIITNEARRYYGDDVKDVTNRIKIMRAVYVVLRESGGNANAFRPASENPDGGDDRGWWQFNSKAWPDVTDAIAYDPIASTIKVGQITKGFSQWGPWKTDRDSMWGLYSNNQHIKDSLDGAANAVSEVLYGSPGDLKAEYGLRATPKGDIGEPMDGVFSSNPVDTVTGAAEGALDLVTDASGAVVNAVVPDAIQDAIGSVGNVVADIGANLIDPKWWLRIGIGLAGFLLIVLALIIYFKDSIKETVSPL